METVFPDLEKQSEDIAAVDVDGSYESAVFFRDHEVHRYLERCGFKQLSSDLKLLQQGMYYSREFFEGVGRKCAYWC